MHTHVTYLALIAFFSLVLPAHDSTSGEMPSTPPTTPLDQQIEASVKAVINRGADIYNMEGDASGCVRFFEGALLIIQPLLGHRASLQREVEQDMLKAKGQTTLEGRAFAYRAMLDKIRHTLNPPKVEEKAGSEGFQLSDTEKALLQLTNKEREQAGLPSLVPNEKLFKAARDHSANMARLGRLDHTLDGKGPAERLSDVGYPSLGWGENCAAGQRRPEDAMASWMNSPGHRGNILNGDFKEVGLGLAADGKGGTYWTQVFARPPGR